MDGEVGVAGVCVDANPNLGEIIRCKGKHLAKVFHHFDFTIGKH